MFISMEVVSRLLADLREDLTRDAIRTIRQKHSEEGLACLARIEGAEMLERAISMACQSAHYRETGEVLPGEAAPPATKKARLPKPVSVVRPRVRPIDKVAGE